MMKHRWGIFLLMVLLTGCVNLQPTKSTVTTYTLNTFNPNVIHARKTARVLLVSTPKAAPGYETSQMLYVDKAHQLNSFSKNRWIASPSEMLVPLFVQSLQSTKHYRAVVSSPYIGSIDFQLDTNLLLLQQEIYGKTNSVHLVLQATLVNTRTFTAIATKRFDIVETAFENTPNSGVMAANRAVSRLLTQVARFCVAKT